MAKFVESKDALNASELSEAIEYKVACRRAMLSYANLTDEQFEARELRRHREAIEYHQTMIERAYEDRASCRDQIKSLTAEIARLRERYKEMSTSPAELRRQERNAKLASMSDNERQAFLVQEQLDRKVAAVAAKLNASEDAVRSAIKS